MARHIVYRGSQALELYLQCYQLVLWKQCYALIHTIGFPTEFEGVVKDLWALRLQTLKEKISEPDSSDVFSSQPESDGEAESTEDEKTREWKVQAKGLPTLIQSVGICYLGAILLRLPVTLGDFHRYHPPSARHLTSENYRSTNVVVFQMGFKRKHPLCQGNSLRASNNEEQTSPSFHQTTRY